jgi:hypothetical protein
MAAFASGIIMGDRRCTAFCAVAAALVDRATRNPGP